jgi:hypothetical protein
VPAETPHDELADLAELSFDDELEALEVLDALDAEDALVGDEQAEGDAGTAEPRA